jgi:CRISPR type III-A-associated protein Csm2
MKEQPHAFSQNRPAIRGVSHGGGPVPPRASLDSVWPRYLEEGYFDISGNVRRDYLSRSKLVPLAEALGNAGLTTHQLRRFFQHCRTIEAKLRAGQFSWSDLEADFLRIDWAAADALGRQIPGFPRLFHDFLSRNVGAVRTGKDFLNGFLPHFEALVGFSSVYLKSSDQK